MQQLLKNLPRMVATICHSPRTETKDPKRNVKDPKVKLSISIDGRVDWLGGSRFNWIVPKKGVRQNLCSIFPIARSVHRSKTGNVDFLMDNGGQQVLNLGEAAAYIEQATLVPTNVNCGVVMEERYAQRTLNVDAAHYLLVRANTVIRVECTSRPC